MIDGDTARIPTRRTVLGLSAVAVAGLIGGCARGTQTGAAPAGEVTLNNDNPTWDPGYASASGPLGSRTGYRLAVRAVPDVSTYQQVVRMSAQTDSSTDLVKWWNGYRLQDLARGGLLSDLSDAWDKAEANHWVQPSMRASFSQDGKPYAVPLYKSYYAVFYSKRAFARVGATVPRTRAAFLATAGRLKAAGVTPIAASGASSWESLIWFSQLLIGADPDYYTAVTNNRASYTDAPAQRAMKQWSQMYAAGLFSTPDFDGASIPADFRSGKVGMTLSGTWNTNTYTTAGLTPADYGIFLLPPVTPGVPPAVTIESGALAVPVNAHKPDAARRVVAAWLADDVQRKWVGFLQDTSANPGVVPNVPAIRELAQQVARVRPREMVRYWEASPPTLIEDNVNDLSSFMVSPTPAKGRQALSSMQARSQRVWKEWET